MPHLDTKKQGCKQLGKCGIHHLCPRFTPQFLQIWDIFARSKFVQIHFFVQ